MTMKSGDTLGASCLRDAKSAVDEASRPHETRAHVAESAGGACTWIHC